jgi:predicted permease
LRIIRQLLAESLILAMVGGGFGLLLGRWGRDILMAAIPELYATIFSFDISLPVIAIVVGLTMLSGLIAGLMPAVLSTRTDLAPVLKGGSDQSVGRLRRSTFQSTLVGFEVSMAVLVLISAGLMIKGFLKIESMELGFNPDDVIHMEVNLSSVGYEEYAGRIQFFRDMIAQIERHSEVSSVSACNPLPYIGWYTPYEIEGADPAQFSHTRSAIDAVVTPGHFRTMEIQLLSGRDFDERDTGEESVPAVVVSETFARLNWPDEDPIGKRMRYADEGSPWRTVIGLVGDTQAGTFMPSSGWFYIPHGQWPSSELILAIRTEADPAAIMDHVKGLVWAIEPDLALQWNGVLPETIADRYPEPPLYSLFLGIFALLAVIMACVGVYGVVAYSVVRRSREFGIRLSIGARPADVVSLVLMQSGKVVVLGMVGGFAASLIVMRLASSIFFGVSPYDPAVYIVCAVIMTVITLLAIWLPARRASRLDPVRVLRVE